MCSTLNLGVDSGNDERAVQRNNLFLLSRMAVRNLLERGMQVENRLLDPRDAHLVNFFVILEKVLRHGLRQNGSIWKQDAQDVWTMLSKAAKKCKQMQETIKCVEELSIASTYTSRLRAWLRLVVMQNKLADYLTVLTDSKLITGHYYEEWAALRHESTAEPFVGSLVGLRALRCEIFLKEESFINQPGEVDLSLLIKQPTFSLEDQSGQQDELDQPTIEAQLKSLLDQISYFEEQNALLRFRARNDALVNRVEESQKVVTLKECYESKSPGDQLEVALSLLERDVHQKQDTICSLREQLQDVKSINADLYKQLRCAEGARREKEFLYSQMQGKSESVERRLRDVSQEMDCRVANLKKDLSDAQASLQSFETELERSTGLCRELQTHLHNEQALRKSAEEQVELLRKESEMHKRKLDVLNEVEKNNRQLRTKCSEMARQIVEYEKALEEVGVHLSQSKLKVEDMKEGLLPFVDARWEEDKNVVDCQRCRLKFSVSRRKHHCRHCGGIFCHQCSENTLPLPSSAKPARVCDNCFNLLLERLTSKIGTPPPSTAMATHESDES